MIKVSSLKENQGRIVRETTCPFVYFDDKGDEQVLKAFRVVYYSLSTEEARKYQAGLNPKEPYYSELLFPLLVSLPDLTDDDDKPVRLTKELLESINGVNLKAILKAIKEDESPKSPGTK